MLSSAKAQVIDLQEMQRQQALQRLNQVAGQKFGNPDESRAFKQLILRREVFMPVKGLTRQENRALYREWLKLKKEKDI